MKKSGDTINGEIDKDFPNSKDFLELELETLRHLRSERYISQYFPEFHRSIENVYFNLEHAIKKSKYYFSFNSGLEFNSPLNRTLYFQISAKVSGNITKSSRSKTDFDYDEVSYILAICKDLSSGNRKILRKYHFDYNKKKVGTRPGPKFHLQYGGKISPFLAGKGFNQNKFEEEVLHSWLSEPRLVSCQLCRVG